MKRIHLRTLREKKHLTQEQLAAMVGVRQAQISALETQVEDPAFSTVAALAKALDVDPLSLKFGRQEQPA